MDWEIQSGSGRLEALTEPNLSDKEAEHHWRKVRELAPGLWGDPEPAL